MYRYRVPATTANLGIGFDCLGMALKLYDHFEIERSDKWIFEGFKEEYANTDNLFVRSYKKACAYKKVKAVPLKVKMKADVPDSRGLGSSACLSVGGIYACHLVNNGCLNREEMLKVATMIEGHPDNAAPAIYGGLCIVNGNTVLKSSVSARWHFGLWIPAYAVKTSEARKVLKDSLPLKDAVGNISSALIAVDALKTFKTGNISLIMNDSIHEPYRRKLIRNWRKMKEYALNRGALAFIISGSGSTCLSISDRKLDIAFEGIDYLELKTDSEGVRNV